MKNLILLLATTLITFNIIGQEPTEFAGNDDKKNFSMYMKYQGDKYFITLRHLKGQEYVIFHNFKKDLMVKSLEFMKGLDGTILIVTDNKNYQTIKMYPDKREIVINRFTYVYQYEVTEEEAKKFQREKKNSTFKRKPKL